MTLTVVLCLALAASAAAGTIGKFDFSYDVPNSHSHKQVSDGDVVKGSYTIMDANGVLRTVRYTADATHGFVVDIDPEFVPLPIKEELKVGVDDGSYHEKIYDGKTDDGSYRGEKHDEGTDDGSYHKERDLATEEGVDDGSYHEDHRHEGDDGSYHEDHRHEGEDGSYHHEERHEGDDGKYRVTC